MYIKLYMAIVFCEAHRFQKKQLNPTTISIASSDLRHPRDNLSAVCRKTLQLVANSEKSRFFKPDFQGVSLLILAEFIYFWTFQIIYYYLSELYYFP